MELRRVSDRRGRTVAAEVKLSQGSDMVGSGTGTALARLYHKPTRKCLMPVHRARRWAAQLLHYMAAKERGANVPAASAV